MVEDTGTYQAFQALVGDPDLPDGQVEQRLQQAIFHCPASEQIPRALAFIQDRRPGLAAMIVAHNARGFRAHLVSSL